MAVNPRDETVYDGKIDETDLQNYPYGKAQNITNPGDGTGTPWDQIFINELWGYFQATLIAAGVVPDGNPETVQASQYLQAMRKIIVDTGAGARQGVFYENDRRVTANYTITATQNAVTAGPITINQALTISLIESNGASIVVTTAVPHSLLAGDAADITGTTNYNGDYVVATVTSPTIFTIANTLNVPAENAGTVNSDVTVTVPNGSTWTVV